MKPSPARRYRPDIDGMRALAVSAVVAFHAFPEHFKGGFIGVDFFFVISGFLISSLILDDMENGIFSFGDFYSRRIRRIFPSLILVLTVSLVVSWFVLLSEEFKQLGKHIAGGAGFSSNFLLWSESGYFDDASEKKPLLHLWSLGIEEQFYILFPFLIYLAHKTRKYIPALLIILSIASFLLNIRTHNPVADFYSPLTRFWELTVGGILSYFVLHSQSGSISPLTKLNTGNDAARTREINKNRLHNFFSLIGFALIAVGLVFLTKEKPFPKWWALLPVSATLFLITAGENSWLNQKILSNRFLVWMGLFSYPVYLWHWPILSFLRILLGNTPSPQIRILAAILSFFLGWLTYRFLEIPLRRLKFNRLKVIFSAALMFLLGISGYSIFKSSGFQFRKVVSLNYDPDAKVDDGVLPINRSCGITNAQDSVLFASCLEDSRGPSTVALFGDSKAEALFPGLFMATSEKSRLLFIGGNGPHGAPTTVISSHPIYSANQKLSVTGSDAIAQNPSVKVVILTTAARQLFKLQSIDSISDLPESEYYKVAFEGLDGMVSKFINAKKKVVITVDNPTLREPGDCIARITSLPALNRFFHLDRIKTCSISIDLQRQYSKKYRDMLYELEKKHPDSLRIFDPTGLLCDQGTGQCSTVLNRRLLYKYSDHISLYGSHLVARKLIPFVEGFGNL